jgi:hypothetical protein
VTALLDRYQPALKALNAGQSCRDCQWPPVSNTSTIDLKSYRYATWLLCVQARHAMTQGQYAQAVNTLKMGFELAQHLAQGPSLIQGLVAVAMASSVCEQIETLIQQSEAPSLFAALRTLPQPFITLGPQMQAEIDNLDHHPQVNALNRGTFETQLTDTHRRIRLLTDNLARRLALLQTIEALRNYMADHEGQWPPSLTQLGPLSTPNDPVTEKPFQYQHSGNTATLKGPMPQNGRAKDALHYELTLE